MNTTDKQVILAAAIDAAYPMPDSPHTSVKERAAADRKAFKRGYLAALPAQVDAQAVGYAIYGIGAGKHYIKDMKAIKPADGDEWKIDDDGLGEYWSGNAPLYLHPPTVAASPSADTRAIDTLKSIRDAAYFDTSIQARAFYRKAENALAAIECRDAVESPAASPSVQGESIDSERTTFEFSEAARCLRIYGYGPWINYFERYSQSACSQKGEHKDGFMEARWEGWRLARTAASDKGTSNDQEPSA